MSDEDAPSREKSPQRQAESVTTHAMRGDDSAFAAFDLFRNYLDSKFTSFKREFSDLSELKKDEIVKRIKNDHSYKFKFAGNQKQYEFNDEILDCLAKISRAADKRDFGTVDELCKSTTEQVRKRNKCIKLADKSPGVGTPLSSTSRMIWRPTPTTIRRSAPLKTGPFEHADSVVNRLVHRAVIHQDPPLVQPIRMSGSSLLRLTLALAVIFVAIGGTEHSLQTSALRATSPDTGGGNVPRPCNQQSK